MRYAADLAPGALRAAVASGGEVVITDSNRRRAFVAGSLEQNVGATLPADQTVSADGIILDPFGRGPDFETVATYTGIRSVSAPFSPQTPQYPEHRPFAALDGSPATAWLADPTLDPGRRYLDVAFTRPIDVPYVDLLPSGPVEAVTVGGRTFAVHPGWNHLVLGARAVSALRVALRRARTVRCGIRELRIPGVRATEPLRLPVDARDALQGANLDRVGLTYLFERTTDDHPFTSGAVIRRVFELPAARTFSASAWVGTFPPDVPRPTHCGAVRFRIDGRVVRIRVLAASSRGGPARAVSCGRPITLSAGSHLLVVRTGPVRRRCARAALGRPGRPGRRPWASDGTGQWSVPGLRPRLARRRPRVGERPVMARARRGLRPRLARHLRRPLARRAGADRRLRQRLADRALLPRRHVHVLAEPAGHDRVHRVRASPGWSASALLLWPIVRRRACVRTERP